jgi:hypothetical protein
MERLLCSAVTDTTEVLRLLSQTLHHLQVQNELLHYENNGLREALTVKRRCKKCSKQLNLQQHKEYHAGAVFWSPCKIREAQARETVLQQQEHEDKLAKANRNELQAAVKLLKEQEKEDRCVARERAKELRDQMKAKQATACAAKIAAQNTIKSSTAAQTGQRKASRAPSQAHKHQKCGGVATAGVQSPEAVPATAPKLNSRGRAIKPPRRYS